MASSPARCKSITLGSILVRDEVISKDQLADALSYSRGNPDIMLGEALVLDVVFQILTSAINEDVIDERPYDFPV